MNEAAMTGEIWREREKRKKSRALKKKKIDNESFSSFSSSIRETFPNSAAHSRRLFHFAKSHIAQKKIHTNWSISTFAHITSSTNEKWKKKYLSQTHPKCTVCKIVRKNPKLFQFYLPTLLQQSKLWLKIHLTLPPQSISKQAETLTLRPLSTFRGSISHFRRPWPSFFHFTTKTFSRIRGVLGTFPIFNL